MAMRAANSPKRSGRSLSRGNAVEMDGGISGCHFPQHHSNAHEVPAQWMDARGEGGKRADENTLTTKCNEVSRPPRHLSERRGLARVAHFVVRFWRVEIHRSARRHGVDDDDITHAIAHRLVVDDLDEDPDRWLVLGPDRAGNLLEVVVLISIDGNEFVIHAMPMRPKYRKLLEP